MKIVSWNINGFKARVKSCLSYVMDLLDADIYCFQETRVSGSGLVFRPKGYNIYLNSALRTGYGGTALFTREKPLKVVFDMLEFNDEEGRFILAEYDNFMLVNVYSPYSRSSLSRLDYRLRWEKALYKTISVLKRAEKPIIMAGDFNVANEPIDLSCPSISPFTPGFTYEERMSFKDLLGLGMVDSLRHIYGPDIGMYSHWSTKLPQGIRIGWRLDYFLVSESFSERIISSDIETYYGDSDHYPIKMEIIEK